MKRYSYRVVVGPMSVIASLSQMELIALERRLEFLKTHNIYHTADVSAFFRDTTWSAKEVHDAISAMCGDEEEEEWKKESAHRRAARLMKPDKPKPRKKIRRPVWR